MSLASALFRDEEIAELFSEPSEVRAMFAVEAALARVQARLGLIPQESADRIGQLSPDVDMQVLRQQTRASGVATIGLLSELGRYLDKEAVEHLHFGATSQDILDSGFILRLRDGLDILDRRLATLIDSLAVIAKSHRDTVTLARTRWQQAVPTSFGLRVAGWLSPLVRHRQRLDEFKSRALVVQLGGAAGNLSALGPRGLEIMDGLADELGLGRVSAPWHVQRDGLIETGQWLALVAGSLGKMGLDVALMAQTEVGEISEGATNGRGGSSTLPQKANLVAPDVLVSIARQTAALAGSLHQAAMPEYERGASAWQIEWLNLPTLMEMTAAALAHAQRLTETIVVHEDRMRENMVAGGDIFLAEAATFALAEFMSRKRAKSLVTEAVAESRLTGQNFIDCLMRRSDEPVDWATLRNPGRALGLAPELVDRVIATIGSRR